MAAAARQVTFRLRVRWWVWPYLHALMFFAWLSVARPDEAKVGRFIARHGIKIEVSKP